ncbi:MAG: hypothetical protein JXQ77_03655 [Campylobacterales bacterium]|nr:hypothetical protein [Campylobacterales bacterium]
MGSKNIKKSFLIAAMAILLHGCQKNTPIVGGPCEYVSYDGTATLEKKENDTGLFSFVPKDKFQESQEFLKNREFEAKLPNGSKIGSKYDASLQIITKGTCTPWILTIKENNK